MRCLTLFFFTFSLIFPLSALAQSDVTKVPKKGSGIHFDIFGEFNSYYKNQDDYHTPLDSSSSSERSGANNRSTQNTRTRALLTFLGKSGKTYSKKNSEFIAVFQLSVDSDDPDHSDNKDEETDGKRKTAVDNKELWIRYSPFEPIGVKIGTQTIKATSTGAEVYHFKGDFDDDFVFYTATTLSEKPGISIDFHPSKNFEIGIAEIEGMGDGARIASRGKSSEAKNRVYWVKGSLGEFDFGIAKQSIEVGGTKEETDPSMEHWDHKYTHTLSNIYAKVTLGAFTPFMGYQTISGDDIEGNEIKANFKTAGLLADIAGGQMAIDYTLMDTPKYGEDGAIAAVVEVDHVIHFNYNYPVTENTNITFFYNALKSKEDSNRKDKEAQYRTAGQTAYAEALESMEWTDTTSVGLQLQMKFKGL